MYQLKRKSKLSRKIISVFVCLTFAATLITPPNAHAQSVNIFHLPAPGTMVNPSPGFLPPIIRGLTIHPDNPLQFDFLVDQGETPLNPSELKEQSRKLIKYFLASLTVSDDDQWVNLSPYEKDRIIPEDFGQTEMGRDLLSQDYILKQLTASLIYPEDELGKKFWDKVYKKAYERFGTTDIPVDTFNKVWIVPDRAVVYEHGYTAFVADSHLKVMLEEDYLALAATKDEGRRTKDETSDVSRLTSNIIKEVILPEIEKEINTGENFAQLRQIYNSMILATWFKQNLKQSLLGQVYVDQSKIKGIDLEDKETKDKIYKQYLAAYKKGVYNYIKEDYDPTTRQTIPRKYFSGGFTKQDIAILATPIFAALPPIAQTNLQNMDSDNAMMTRVQLVEDQAALALEPEAPVDEAIVAVSDKEVLKDAKRRIKAKKDSIITWKRIEELIAALVDYDRTLVISTFEGGWIHHELGGQGFYRYAKGQRSAYQSVSDNSVKREKDEIKLRFGHASTSDAYGFVITQAKFAQMIADLLEANPRAARSLVDNLINELEHSSRFKQHVQDTAAAQRDQAALALEPTDAAMAGKQHPDDRKAEKRERKNTIDTHVASRMRDRIAGDGGPTEREVRKEEEELFDRHRDRAMVSRPSDDAAMTAAQILNAIRPTLRANGFVRPSTTSDSYVLERPAGWGSHQSVASDRDQQTLIFLFQYQGEENRENIRTVSVGPDSLTIRSRAYLGQGYPDQNWQKTFRYDGPAPLKGVAVTEGEIILVVDDAVIEEHQRQAEEDRDENDRNRLFEDELDRFSISVIGQSEAAAKGQDFVQILTDAAMSAKIEEKIERIQAAAEEERVRVKGLLQWNMKGDYTQDPILVKYHKFLVSAKRISLDPKDEDHYRIVRGHEFSSAHDYEKARLIAAGLDPEGILQQIQELHDLVQSADAAMGSTPQRFVMRGEYTSYPRTPQGGEDEKRRRADLSKENVRALIQRFDVELADQIRSATGPGVSADFRRTKIVQLVNEELGGPDFLSRLKVFDVRLQQGLVDYLLTGRTAQEALAEYLDYLKEQPTVIAQDMPVNIDSDAVNVQARLLILLAGANSTLQITLTSSPDGRKPVNVGDNFQEIKKFLENNSGKTIRVAVSSVDKSALDHEEASAILTRIGRIINPAAQVAASELSRSDKTALFSVMFHERQELKRLIDDGDKEQLTSRLTGIFAEETETLEREPDDALAEQIADALLKGKAFLEALDIVKTSDLALLAGVEVDVPASFGQVLAAQHGLSTQGIRIKKIKGDGDVRALLRDAKARYLIESSSAATLGSFYLRGRGRKTPAGLDIKNAGDATALKLIEDETARFIRENPQYAIVELASEGARDGAVSTPVGRIHHASLEDNHLDTVTFVFDEKKKAYIKSFSKDLYTLTLDELRARGVTILFKITDSLEKTEGLVNPESLNNPTDSWALNGFIVHTDDQPYPLPIDDNFRTAGYSYNAPRKANIGPLDMPSQAIPEIAKANGIQLWKDNTLPEDQREITGEYKAFLENVVLVLLGPRGEDLKNLESSDSRHKAFITDAQQFMELMYTRHGVALFDADTDTPGMRLDPVTDGDLMPRLMAEAGPMELNDHQYVITFGRSGSAEAEAARAWAQTVEGAHMVGRRVSTLGTADHVGYDTADDYTRERSDKQPLRLAELDINDILGYDESAPFTVTHAEDNPQPTLIAMSPVTGATAHLGVNFKNTMTRVQHNAEDGTITTRTLISDEQGNIYVVEVTYETAYERLRDSVVSLLSAHPTAKAILEELPELADAAMMEEQREIIEYLSEDFFRKSPDELVIKTGSQESILDTETRVVNLSPIVGKVPAKGYFEYLSIGSLEKYDVKFDVLKGLLIDFAKINEKVLFQHVVFHEGAPVAVFGLTNADGRLSKEEAAELLAELRSYLLVEYNEITQTLAGEKTPRTIEDAKAFLKRGVPAIRYATHDLLHAEPTEVTLAVTEEEGTLILTDPEIEGGHVVTRIEIKTNDPTDALFDIENRLIASDQPTISYRLPEAYRKELRDEILVLLQRPHPVVLEDAAMAAGDVTKFALSATPSNQEFVTKLGALLGQLRAGGQITTTNNWSYSDFHKEAVRGENVRFDDFLAQIQYDPRLIVAEQAAMTQETEQAVKEGREIADPPSPRFSKIAQAKLLKEHGYQLPNGTAIYLSRIDGRSAAFTVHHEDEEFQVDANQKSSTEEGRPNAASVLEKALEYLKGKELLQLDVTVGQDPAKSPHARLLVDKNYGRLAHELSILQQPSGDVYNETDRPDMLTIDLPDFDLRTIGEKQRRPYILRMPSLGITIILGSDYFGEIKKSFLTQLGHQEKLKGNVALHAGGLTTFARNADGELVKKNWLVMGLSGTGKTSTVAQDHGLSENGELAVMRNDDFMVLEPEYAEYMKQARVEGIWRREILSVAARGTENGSYVKTEDVTRAKEPRIYDGVTNNSTSVLENIWVEETPGGLQLDLLRYDMTRNGRAILTREAMVGKEVAAAHPSIDMDSVDFFMQLTRGGKAPAMSLPDAVRGTGMFLLGETVITSAASNNPADWGPKRASLYTAFTMAPHGKDALIVLNVAEETDMQFVVSNTGAVGYQEDTEGNVIEPGEDVSLKVSSSFIRALARGTAKIETHPVLRHDVVTGGVTDLSGQEIDVSRFLPDQYFEDFQGAVSELEAERVAFLNDLNTKLRDPWKVPAKVISEFISSTEETDAAMLKDNEYIVAFVNDTSVPASLKNPAFLRRFLALGSEAGDKNADRNVRLLIGILFDAAQEMEDIDTNLLLKVASAVKGSVLDIEAAFEALTELKKAMDQDGDQLTSDKIIQLIGDAKGREVILVLEVIALFVREDYLLTIARLEKNHLSSGLKDPITLSAFKDLVQLQIRLIRTPGLKTISDFVGNEDIADAVKEPTALLRYLDLVNDQGKRALLNLLERVGRRMEEKTFREDIDILDTVMTAPVHTLAVLKDALGGLEELEGEINTRLYRARGQGKVAEVFTAARIAEFLQEVDLDDRGDVLRTMAAFVRGGAEINEGNIDDLKQLIHAKTIADLSREAADAAMTATEDARKEILSIGVFAQRVVREAKAGTGQLNGYAAKRAGANGAMAGHSDVRKDFGDTDEDVADQLKLIHEIGFKDRIFAFGEPPAVRKWGTQKRFVKRQILKGLAPLTAEEVAQTIFAYEPIWAIGTGLTAKSKQVQTMAKFVRDVVREQYGDEVADQIRILYGGSVVPSNAAELITLEDVDGFLIGGASNQVEDITAIIKAVENQGPTNGRIPYVGGNNKTKKIKSRFYFDAAVALAGVDPERVQVAFGPSVALITEAVTAIASAETTIRSAAELRAAIEDINERIKQGETPQQTADRILAGAAAKAEDKDSAMTAKTKSQILMVDGVDALRVTRVDKYTVRAERLKGFELDTTAKQEAYYQALLFYLHKEALKSGKLLQLKDTEGLKGFQNFLQGNGKYKKPVGVEGRELDFSSADLTGTRQFFGSPGLRMDRRIFNFRYRASDSEKDTVLTFIDWDDPGQGVRVIPDNFMEIVGPGTIAQKVAHELNKLGVTLEASNRTPNHERAGKIRNRGIPVIPMSPLQVESYREAGFHIFEDANKEPITLESRILGRNNLRVPDLLIDGIDGKPSVVVNEDGIPVLSDRNEPYAKLTDEAKERGGVRVDKVTNTLIVYEQMLKKSGIPLVIQGSNTPKLFDALMSETNALAMFDKSFKPILEKLVTQCLSCNTTQTILLLATALSDQELVPGSLSGRITYSRRASDRQKPTAKWNTEGLPDYNLFTHQGEDALDFFEQIGVMDGFEVLEVNVPGVNGKVNFATHATFNFADQFHLVFGWLKAETTNEAIYLAERMKERLARNPFAALVYTGDKVLQPLQISQILQNDLERFHAYIHPVFVFQDLDRVGFLAMTPQESNVIPNNVSTILLKSGLIDPDDVAVANSVVHESMRLGRIKRSLERILQDAVVKRLEEEAAQAADAAMTAQELLPRVIAIIEKELKLESGSVQADSELMDDLGADSLKITEIAMALEDNRLGDIKAGDEEGLFTPRDFAEYLADSAMTTMEKPVGGIDLNRANLDLQIKRDGNGVPLPVNLQPLETMNIEGFVPIIINIAPVQNLPMLLGLSTQGLEEETADNAPAASPFGPAAYFEEKRKARELELSKAYF